MLTPLCSLRPRPFPATLRTRSWYVAVTRAKKVLSIPAKVSDFLRGLRDIHRLALQLQTSKGQRSGTSESQPNVTPHSPGATASQPCGMHTIVGLMQNGQVAAPLSNDAVSRIDASLAAKWNREIASQGGLVVDGEQLATGMGAGGAGGADIC